MSPLPGPGSANDALNTPAGVSRTVQVVAGVLPLGSVPYDNMTLPLVSPDGRWLATQTAAPPTWGTALAEQGAHVPSATHVKVYQLDLREGIDPKDRKAPVLKFGLTESVLLGRSCDSEGFLIESPREDGSRWIGKASWKDGTIAWLVQGSDVNAFAALGTRNRLAWSRRTQTADKFDLVVRDGAQEWSVSGAGESWIMPQWSNQDDGLFVLTLADGSLDANFGLASTQAEFEQSRQHLALATESTVYTAYQSMSGQTGAVDGTTTVPDQLVFFHPAARRAALWRPLADSSRRFAYLYSKSIAGLVDEEEFAFTATNDGLLRQSLARPSEYLQLVAGTQIPRATTSSSWPFMLLSPGQSSVGIMAMRLLPREDAVFTSRKTPR